MDGVSEIILALMKNKTCINSIPSQAKRQSPWTVCSGNCWESVCWPYYKTPLSAIRLSVVISDMLQHHYPQRTTTLIHLLFALSGLVQGIGWEFANCIELYCLLSILPEVNAITFVEGPILKWRLAKWRISLHLAWWFLSWSISEWAPDYCSDYCFIVAACSWYT